MPDSGFLGNQSLTQWGTHVFQEVSWAGAAGGPGLDRASLHLEGCFWSSAQSRGALWGPHVRGEGTKVGKGAPFLPAVQGRTPGRPSCLCLTLPS